MDGFDLPGLELGDLKWNLVVGVKSKRWWIGGEGLSVTAPVRLGANLTGVIWNDRDI